MINKLVTHKTLNLGIGCISREFKNSVGINFGYDDYKKYNINDLNIIDTNNCPVVSYLEFVNRIYKINSTLNNVIVGNELKEYVGIGWVTTRIVTIDDLTKYPRVI